MREKPAASIIQYILDLKTDFSVGLRRTKLMVVGYEKVGKTSLLECLSPLSTCRPVIHNGQQVRLEIVEKDFIVHPFKPVTPSASSSPSITIPLGDGKWSVSASPTTIELTPSSPSAGQSPPLQFTIDDKTEREEVVKRLKRICGDERTHGIDIQRQLIPFPPLIPNWR